jgi:hypothetical protein
MNIGEDEELYLGEDKHLDLEVLDDDDVPVNVTGWTATFDMRDHAHSDQTVISRSCSVVGTYSATRALNTQRLRAALTDDDSSTGSKPLFPPGLYAYSFKRTTAGDETVLRAGLIRWREATQK